MLDATETTPTRTKEEIIAWLLTAVANELQLDADQIAPSDRFGGLGADSLSLLNIGGELEDWLGSEIPPSLLWEYPSISTLASAIAEGRHLATESE